MWYINIGRNQGTETIDEFETHAEALRGLKEYRLVYLHEPVLPRISRRATKAWRER